MSSLNPSKPLDRRQLLTGVGAVAASAVLATSTAAQADAPASGSGKAIVNNRIKQSVVHWCFRPMKLETLARHAAAMGIKSVELVSPKDWPILKKHGLECAITSSHGFARGFADPDKHDECIAKLTTAIDATSAAGWSNVITFSGITKGITKEQGIKNAVAGLKRIVGYAEKKKVNLCIEMLNSRVDTPMKGHPGYMADTVEWVIEVCKQIGSPRMKLLFDIYHVQIMQGDVITRINKYKEYIAHYHTAGNPGRNEIEGDQEINYPGIMKAIVATGYQGYVGQEFIPTDKDPAAALRRAAKICDV